MMKYFYVYILHSEKDGNFYVGFTNDLNKRIKEHDDGKVASTKKNTHYSLFIGNVA